MHSTKIILVTAIAVLAGTMNALAAPVSFNEVSLWVRAKETDKSILSEVSQRKLTKALTPQQESTLKSQGASDSLVQSLRNSALVASSADIAASEAKAPAPKVAPAPEPDHDSVSDNLQVFDVTAGHPINLSQFGGPDYEFAFNIYRYAGENIVEPVMVDPVRTYTDVAHYVGPLGTVPVPRRRISAAAGASSPISAAILKTSCTRSAITSRSPRTPPAGECQLIASIPSS